MEKGKENKKIIYIIIGLIVILITFIVLFLNKDSTGFGSSSNNLICKIENTIIDGFKNKESIILNIKNNKVNRIKLDRSIILNDKYSEDKTYLDSLNTSLENAYNDLKGVNIKKNKESIKVTLNIKKKGIILNNLSMKKNSDLEDTSLRFDVLTDLKEENAIKIGDKVGEVKEKLSSIGYNCN